MWPFKKKPSSADAVIAVMPDAISLCSKQWLYYTSTLVFKDEVPLRDRILSFASPMTEGLKNTFAALGNNAPPAIFMLIIAKGIEKSGTHSTAEIEAALGVALPAD
jgi:hypothetical protein